MSEEIKKKELEAAFDKALEELNKLRGNIKAFIFLALTDEHSKEDEEAVCGVNAVGGKVKDLITLFHNINPDIKRAAATSSLVEVLGEVFGGEEKSAPEKDEKIQSVAPCQHK